MKKGIKRNEDEMLERLFAWTACGHPSSNLVMQVLFV